ncbi:hypothetical protein AVEN_121864-1 [Araneus ventricosus]|uniref:RNase H type-1 domain-containing protein n=1 Tax=Araneus ventricosus TaxID=182803 RepID=A0A4Y2S4X7_ARAVE|nr:hypothetical protein AVEN_121864-1 [Araneus ventricosus]
MGRYARLNRIRTIKGLCNSCVLHLQCIPSHVNLRYNDIAGSLAKEGTTMPQAYVEPLTYIELYSRRKAAVSWRHPPDYSWYCSEGPGASIHFKGDRKGFGASCFGSLNFRSLKNPQILSW